MFWNTFTDLQKTSGNLEKIQVKSWRKLSIIYIPTRWRYCYNPLLSISWMSLLFTTMGRPLGREHFASLPSFPFPLHLLPARLPQVWLLGWDPLSFLKGPPEILWEARGGGGAYSADWWGWGHLTAEDLHIDYHIVKQKSSKRCFADFVVIVHFSPQMPVCYYFVLWLIQKLVN